MVLYNKLPRQFLFGAPDCAVSSSSSSSNTVQGSVLLPHYRTTGGQARKD